MISLFGCEEKQFEDLEHNSDSIKQSSIETGNYNQFKGKPLFTKSFNYVTNLISVDSSTIVEMSHNDYISYNFLVEDDNGLDNRVTNMVVSYVDGNFINKALLDYSFFTQTQNGSVLFNPSQLYSFPNGECGYIIGVSETPTDITYSYNPAPCSAGAVDSSNLDPGGVAAVLADLSPSNGGGSNPENSYGLPLHGAYTSYPVTPGYSGYVGGYSDYYGSQPFGPTLYNPNNPPSEGGFYDDLINGNKNITTPILLSAIQRFVMNLSPELSQLYDNLTPTQQSSIEDFIEDNNSSYEEYWDAKSFAEEVIVVFNENPELDWSFIENWFLNSNSELEPNLNIDPSQITYDQPIIQESLPSFEDFVDNFPKTGTEGNYFQMPTSDVYQLVGGSLWTSHQNNPSAYSNACSIRGSRGLIKSGVNIPVLNYPGVGQRTQKGGDGNNYILDAVSFDKFMRDKFGPATYELTGVDANDMSKVAETLKGKNGIYVIINSSHQQAGYSGHVDAIINGKCISNAYTTPNGGVKSIRIWVLN